MTERTIRLGGFGVHYGWVIAVTGTLCIFACLGFGRFALGMLLPSMASSVGLSYSQIGYISTANFVGYLLSVLFCGQVAARTGARMLIFVALLVIAGSMLLISRASGFASILLLYAITGLGSGATNVPVMALVTRWFDSSIRARAAGFVAIGSGFAIIVSGQLIPFVNRTQGAEGWRTSWLILAVWVAAIAVVALLLLRDSPHGTRAVSAAGSRAVPPPAAPVPRRSFYATPAVYLLGVIYALFGFTYAIYVTFIVTSLVRERGFSEAAAGGFWSWVGLLSLVSGPVFGAVSDRLGRRAGLMIVFALQGLAYLLAAGRLPDVFLYFSIGFFGIVAWSVPSIMVAAVSEYVGGDQALKAFGFITFFFGIGQITGPAIAGALAEATGSFSWSFGMAAAFAALAIVACAFLRRRSAP